jgi:shikimate dehydrogenase
MKIDAQTQVFGIIGNPLGHTFSPAMHNAGYAAKKFNAAYLAFPIKNLIQLKYSMKQWNIRGLSVTIPYKISIRRILDRIDPLALQIGSVNTILWGKTGLLEGYNTDGPGAIMALTKARVPIAGKKILVIGAGGSARSIAFALAREKPAEIGVMARNPMMAMQLARNLTLNKNNPKVTLLFTEARQTLQNSLLEFMPQSGRKWSSLRYNDPEMLKDFDLIINTTPMGMKGSQHAAQSPLKGSELWKHQTVFDIVYNPAQTPLLKIAHKKRCNVVLGHKMLLYQGVLQFELFTGRAAPVKAMEKALMTEIKAVS